jgi:hypothetical protein
MNSVPYRLKHLTCTKTWAEEWSCSRWLLLTRRTYHSKSIRRLRTLFQTVSVRRIKVEQVSYAATNDPVQKYRSVIVGGITNLFSVFGDTEVLHISQAASVASFCIVHMLQFQEDANNSRGRSSSRRIMRYRMHCRD